MISSDNKTLYMTAVAWFSTIPPSQLLWRGKCLLKAPDWFLCREVPRHYKVLSDTLKRCFKEYVWMWATRRADRWMLTRLQTREHIQPFLFSPAMAHSQLPALAIAFHQNVCDFKSWINTSRIQEVSKGILGALKIASVLKCHLVS